MDKKKKRLENNGWKVGNTEDFIDMGKKENMNKQMTELRKRSRSVNSNDKVIAFLYELMRDYITCGEAEAIMAGIKEEKIEYEFCNGYLANYAKDIARRLQ